MGQTADEMRGYVPVDADDQVAHVDPEEQETEEIRARIEETRAEMSGTIDAIQEKLSPDNIKEQAKEMVREATVGRAEDMVSNVSQTAKGFGADMLETIKQNPLPAALAGIGIGWLLMKNSEGSSKKPMQYRYRTDYGTYQTYDQDGQTGNKVGQIAGQAQQKVGQIAGEAGDKVGQIAGEAGEKVGQLGDQVGQIGEQAQYKAEQATDWFQRSLRDNPLAVGAVAVAIGAAAGLLLPETAQEHQIMGEARDNLMDRAQGVVQETVQKVQRVAEEAQSAVQREAQNQGLAQQDAGQDMAGATQS
jgi:ElaB/YqjD/DUF883 family membrane-anchored ribosome-binding protein